MNEIKRRTFIQGTTSALFFLAGLTGRRVEGAELSCDMQARWPMMKKSDLPDAVRILGGYLEAFSPPVGAMDAQGGWTAFYDILAFSASPAYRPQTGPAMTNRSLGQLAITKRAATDYEVRMLYRPTSSIEEVRAKIACSGDVPAALKSWEMEWSCRGRPEELAYTNRERGTVYPDRFEIVSRGATSRFELNQPLTCLWTLMDAVGRRSARSGWKQAFDMYMDLSSLRRNQMLSFAGKGTAAVASGPLDLNLYEQTGEGVEPIHYAVDQQQRTLFVTQGQLGWALSRIEVAR